MFYLQGLSVVLMMGWPRRDSRMDVFPQPFIPTSTN